MSQQTALPTFDVGGPLPVGRTTLIEASAGTGKTYTLSALAVRFVAEHDISISRILIVTFTRAATAELRDRIRKRLVEAEQHLSGPPPAPGDPGPSDPVLTALDHPDPAERERRRERLARAVSEFDTATISTIHGFCAQVRTSMGVLSKENVDAVPAQSESELIAEVCADLYFQTLSEHPENPFGTRKFANFLALVKKTRTLNGSTLRAEGELPADRLAADLTKTAIKEIDDRLRRSGGQSFDGLLTSVREALRSEPHLLTAVRQQFDVALIDEFQDTDPTQWEIFHRIFGPEPAHAGPRPSLILVGDPKQAIYSFRGGDVYTYLDAKTHAEGRALATNQRSDEAVLTAMNALGAGEVFGEEEIAYQPVEAAHRNRGRHVTSSSDRVEPGLVVRVLEDPAVGGEEELTADGVRRAIATDLAAVAHRILTAHHIRTADGELHPVRPGHIAVLVGAASDARPVHAALRKAGIPAVLRLRDDVADSDARQQWRMLLQALDRPANTGRAAAAALTWFFGWTPDRVAAAVDARNDPAAPPGADEDLVKLQHELAEWDELLTEKGMAALFGKARRCHDMVSRLLATDTGERDLTDLEHLAELIHAEAREQGRGLTAGTALAILETLGGTPDDEIAADAAQRRIESDAEAVQIMTIHGSKGLEFPFVLLPTLWSGGNRVQANRPFTYFDQSLGGRVIDVTTATIGKRGGLRTEPDVAAPQASAEAKRQACGDQHRLTYVAMTRAVHQTVAWWAPVTRSSSHLSGLARLLFGAGSVPAGETPDNLPSEAHADAIRARLAAAGSAAAVHEITELPRLHDLGPLPAPDATAVDPEQIRVATLGRRLDRVGKVWSFSSMSKGLKVGVQPVTDGDPTIETADDKKAGDEAPHQDRAEEATEPGPAWQQVSPFEGLGGGKDFGNLVHHVLERVDFRAADPAAAVTAVLDQPTGYRLTDAQRERLPGVLADVIATPLGASFGHLRLADLEPANRLNELGFHLPLAPGRPVSAAHIGAVVADHLASTDPLHQWALGLRRGLAGTRLEGFLNGSIDLTLRFEVDGVTRYSVVDYKTNNLAPGVESPPLLHYGHHRLVKAMADNQYALQALIYTVALHRYLRWRLPDYDPAVHLGPVGYLYVRGMVGETTPIDPAGPGGGTPAGVYTWQVPPELVVELSALFAGDVAEAS